MAHERIAVITDHRNLEGVSPEAGEAILANTNPKFRMFIDEYPKSAACDTYDDQMRADYRALDVKSE